jgi:hypothetical protein
MSLRYLGRFQCGFDLEWPKIDTTAIIEAHQVAIETSVIGLARITVFVILSSSRGRWYDPKRGLIQPVTMTQHQGVAKFVCPDSMVVKRSGRTATQLRRTSWLDDDIPCGQITWQ